MNVFADHARATAHEYLDRYGDAEAAWRAYYHDMEGFDGETVIAASCKKQFMSFVGTREQHAAAIRAYAEAQEDEERMIAEYMARHQ